MKATIVIGLGYGDEGKGRVVDYLAHEQNVKWVVRFNGGSNAGHNVVTPGGRHHTFSQFGSGMFKPDCNTYLSEYVLVDPIAMMSEAKALESKNVQNVFHRTVIHPNCLMITPFHIAANRIRELARGDSCHGSCGKGLGETVNFHLNIGPGPRIRDVRIPGLLRARLDFVQKTFRAILDSEIQKIRNLPEAQKELDILLDNDCVDTAMEFYSEFARKVWIEELCFNGGNIIFEGAQGVLLDEWRGFHPYTTWSTCTPHNALALLKNWGGGWREGNVGKMGVIRTFMTRHGPGPFVTEDEHFRFHEPHNNKDQWQKNFRFGHMDGLALEYAVKACNGIDSLAITHIDRLDEMEPKICRIYNHEGEKYFEHPSPSNDNDLKYQEMLANWLFNTKPDYGICKKKSYLCKIRISTMTRMGLSCYGPTRDETRRT